MEYPFPSSTVDPYTLSDDEFGYSVYSLVLFATPEQQHAVQAVRDRVSVQKSMLPAHVTAKGPFCRVPSVTEVQGIIDDVIRGLPPIQADFGPDRIPRTLSNGERIGWIDVNVSSGLAELHGRLLDALDSVATNAYPPEARGWFHPHLTVYHEPDSESEELEAKLLRDLNIGTGFRADALSLMGHVGTPYRGEWVSISDHPFI